MTVHATLDRIATSEFTLNNILTDGQFTCSYAEVPACLSQIEDFLEGHGITPDHTLSIECINSLTGALLLLTLLRAEYSFALAPPVAVNSELKPTPHFCSHRLTVTSESSGAAKAFAPALYLRVESHPRYNGCPADRAKLYFRTSGSMGASKIVVHSHEKLLGNASNVVRKYGFTSASRAVIPVPIAHMYGFGAEFLPAITVGASIDLQEKTNLLKYLDREKRFQPTIAFVTPNICEMLLKGYKAPRTGYQAFVTSGQRISEELFRAFDPLVAGHLINQYGSTEMGATAACGPGDDLEQRCSTIGQPMGGVELRIEAPQRNGDMSTGELYCRHPYGFEGYVDEDGDWLQQAPADNWYRTGDLAVAGPDGRISVSGRADASANRSGYLVLLSDIERVLEKLETMEASVVVAGNGGSKHGTRIAAFCVARPGNVLDGSQVRQRCFDLLPHYAIPDEVHVLDTLPTLPSGKVDRQALAALVGSSVSLQGNARENAGG